MESNGPLAIVPDFLAWHPEAGETRPVLPSASLTSQCVSAGRFAAPSLAPLAPSCLATCDRIKC